jgi:predicted patatin/cPLA2 family phospholipase
MGKVNKKIAIITSEGGMTCSYSVGGLFALKDKYHLTEPYVAVGSSGGAPNLAFYVAGQCAEIQNIWKNLLPTSRFISIAHPTEIMDIDYMIDEIFKKQDPLNAEAVKNAKTKLFISATDYETGEPVYFSNRDDIDIFEVLRASTAAIIVYNKTVTINGRKYVDGAFGAPVYRNVEKAFQEGAEKVIVIDNANKPSLRSWLALSIYAAGHKGGLGNAIKRYIKEENKHYNYETDNPNVFVVTPSAELSCGMLDNKRDKIVKTVARGYKDVLDNKELEKFLN